MCVLVRACYLEPNTTSTTTTCDIAGNGGTVINGSCYAIIASAALSWFDARYKCETLGADLAVFDETSSSDSSAIYSLLPNATLFWIGLRKNPWIWVKGFDTGLNVHDLVHKGQMLPMRTFGDHGAGSSDNG